MKKMKCFEYGPGGQYENFAIFDAKMNLSLTANLKTRPCQKLNRSKTKILLSMTCLN